MRKRLNRLSKDAQDQVVGVESHDMDTPLDVLGVGVEDG